MNANRGIVTCLVSLEIAAGAAAQETPIAGQMMLTTAESLAQEVPGSRTAS
jgi:hypothetical protein